MAPIGGCMDTYIHTINYGQSNGKEISKMETGIL